MRSINAGPRPGISARARAVLRSASGAFDLPSIITGVVVVAVLAGGVFAAIFGVIPFAQENAAHQDLAAVRTAEAVAKTKDGKFLDVAGLRSAGYLPSVTSAAAAADGGEFTRVAAVNSRKPTFTVGVGPNGTCYVALSFSPGKTFYATDTVPEPRVLLTGKETGCLSLAEVEALAASIDAPTTSAATPSDTPSAAVPAATPVLAPASPQLASWGGNTYGQLGNGTNVGPQLGAANVKFAAAPRVINEVSASKAGNFSCAAIDDSVSCWGENAYGQLGVGTTTIYSPTTVPGLPAGKKFTSVSTGYNYTCAIADTGYCWGRNNNGQLGIGSTTDNKTPSKLTGPLLDKPLTKISAGSYHACAISNDQAYCWGYKSDGRVSSPLNGADQLVPVLVGGPLAGKKVTDISAGGAHTCAVADGQVYCWGKNANGQLGNGTSAGSFSPVVVGGLLAGKTVTAVSAGGADIYGHTCAIADGAAYCWGADILGRLGNGTGGWYAGPGTTVPAPMSRLEGKTVTSISAGLSDTCVVADGVGYCAGDNQTGAIGDTVRSYSTLPVAVVGAEGPMLRISAGGTHTLGMYDSANPAPALPAAAALPVLASYQPGTLSGSGSDLYGQLGNNAGITKNPAPVTINGLTNVTKAATGVYHTCAISNDQAYCWGNNGYGQLGDNTTVTKKAPVAVKGMEGKKVTDITVGTWFSCAVADGQGYCWGRDDVNQLGNGGTIANSSQAMPLINKSGAVDQPMAGKTVTSISAGYQHACAVADYRVYCWGYNNNGQLSVQNNFPAGIPGPVYGELARRNVTAVSAGYTTTCAVADGAAWCWGSNTNGMLGTGNTSTADVREPVKVGGALAGKTVTSVAAGTTTCAVADGAAYCWGQDAFGTVGNGQIDGATDVNATGTPVIKNYLAPYKVVDTGVLAGKTVTSISVGNDSDTQKPVCAVASGAAFCWGYGVNGELGNGAFLNSDVPVAVKPVAGQVLTVSAGQHHVEMTSK